MTRSVEEWIADHDDQPIPKRVRLRIWERCGGKCAITGHKLRPGDAHDFDHIIALANGGEHRESNLQLLSRTSHREKTKADVGLSSKIRRQSLKHKGLWPKSRRPIKSRGFDKSRDV